MIHHAILTKLNPATLILRLMPRLMYTNDGCMKNARQDKFGVMSYNCRDHLRQANQMQLINSTIFRLRLHTPSAPYFAECANIKEK